MAKNVEDEVVYHYDFYPTEEDLMGETSVHMESFYVFMTKIGSCV
jgi:hypothetical protein